MNAIKWIIDNLTKVISEAVIDITDKSIIKLQTSPNPSHGDFAFGVFSVADMAGYTSCPFDISKEERKKISTAGCIKLAKEIAGLIPPDEVIETVTAVGPFVNFKVRSSALLNLAFASADHQTWRKLLPKQKTMVEFLSPNTNKPLHLGHLRNMCLGDAVAGILAATGQDVVKANLINDRGIHISKSMLAWQLWGNNTTPESTNKKGDHFVGDFYVRFSKAAETDPTLMERAQEMLLAWEASDPEIIALWQKMNGWVMNGFNQTCSNLGVQFDKVYYESDTFRLGKDIVEHGIQLGLFQKGEDGSIFYELPITKFGLNADGKPKRTTLQRADGTSVYMTQDLGTAVMKVTDYGLNRSIYVVGSEQDHHFKSLFFILKQLGYEWADNCHHLSYGMVNLPEGKMKSREGTVVDADDLMMDMVEMAKEAITTKHPDLKLDEVTRRAEIIGLGALKFYLLVAPPANTMAFDPTKSISFDGITGPYCQYAVARARSILRKAAEKNLFPATDWTKFDVEGWALVHQIIELPNKIKEAGDKLDPSILARHIFEIAKAFNQYYRAVPILSDRDDAPLTEQRLAMIDVAQNAVANGLSILGIGTVEEM
ncbi:MAG: arginine--tRNA ligase [Candidatus Magasanikbacteria bacterium]